MNQRQQQAMEMIKPDHHAEMYELGKFRVRSQKDYNKWYNVDSTGNGLKCSCYDNKFRRSDCRHIHVIKIRIIKNGFSKKFKIMSRDDFKIHKFCDSGNITKYGFKKTKKGNNQQFKCLECNKIFTTNYDFESMRYDDVIITSALQMYFSDMSVRKISDHFEMLGTDVSHVTIYKWICKYSKFISKYLERITPRLSTWWRADET